MYILATDFVWFLVQFLKHCTCYSVVLSDSGLSMCCLKRSIRSSVAGRFQIPSCASHLDSRLLKSCCLHTDLS
jgi:hypothetical protein